MARADDPDAHTHNRPFSPRECLHAREPQGSGTYSIPIEESQGTTGVWGEEQQAAWFNKASTRDDDEPGAHTKNTSGVMVQSTLNHRHVRVDDGGGLSTHG